MEDRETARMCKYGDSKTTRIMTAIVPHVTSGSGLRKFQADGFLIDRVYENSQKPVQKISGRWIFFFRQGVPKQKPVHVSLSARGSARFTTTTHPQFLTHNSFSSVSNPVVTAARPDTYWHTAELQKNKQNTFQLVTPTHFHS